MSSIVSPSPAERVLDLAAASIPAVAAGWSAATLAPFMEMSATPAIAVAAISCFALAFAVMRTTGARTHAFKVPQFEASESFPSRIRTFSPPTYDEELLLDVPAVDEQIEVEWSQDSRFADIRMQFAAKAAPESDDILLLDELYEAAPVQLPLSQNDVERRIEQLSELILDDPLTMPSPDSRVVRLFAPQPVQSAGEMVRNIARHMDHRSEPMRQAAPDASDALNEALDSLRDTLRRA